MNRPGQSLFTGFRLAGWLVALFPLVVGWECSLRAHAGQGSAAGMAGAVKDPSGRAVAGAKVLARNETTGQTRETSTNQDGAYALNSLLPGSYTLRVAAQGFKPFSKKGSMLAAGKVLAVDVTLQRESSGPAPGGTAPSGESELSLGEIARRLRKQKQSPSSPLLTFGNELFAEHIPDGFSIYTHPEGHFTVLLPDDREMLARPVMAGETDRSFRINSLPGNPGEAYAIWLSATREGSAGQTSDLSVLDAAEQEILKLGNETINLQEDLPIHGRPARLVRFDTAGQGLVPQSYLVGFIRVPGGWIAARCWTSKERFPAIEPACRTTITSIRPLAAPTDQPDESKPQPPVEFHP